MSAYLAIIKDSFREAMASWVLWILLVLIALALLVFAPIGYREQLTTGLNQDDVYDWSELAQTIREGRREEDTPAARVWSLLGDEARQKLLKFRRLPAGAGPERRSKYVVARDSLQASFDNLLQEASLYDDVSWQRVDLANEGRRLLDVTDEASGKSAKSDPSILSDEQRARLNRLLFEAAFPKTVKVSLATSVQFTYFGLDIFWPAPVRADRLEKILQPAVTLVLDWFAGPVGVFVAILVTASIIPQTFDPHSLSLLLSKPISRWLLYVTKFLGGCAFTLISAVFLLTGMWLILGLRLGIWNHQLLLYIPIFLFLFAIYYSVSALAGLIWRSTIVSVAASILFWAMCFGVGTAQSVMENIAYFPLRIKNLIVADDQLLAVNEVNTPYAWDAESKTWKIVFLSDGQAELRRRMSFPVPFPPLTGPIYDAPKKRILAAQGSLRGPNNKKLWTGSADDQWRRKGGAKANDGLFALFQNSHDEIIGVSRQDILRLTGDPAADAKALAWMEFIPGLQDNIFSSADAEPPLRLSDSAAAAFDAQNDVLFIYDRGRVFRFTLDDNQQYRQAAAARLDVDSEDAAVLSVAGKTLLVACEDGQIFLLDAHDLRQRSVQVFETRGSPRFAYAAPGGGWMSILFHNGKLWLYDAAAGKFLLAPVAAQGDISGTAFSGPNRLLIAHHTSRVTEYDLRKHTVVSRRAPEITLTDRIYYYGIVPLYTVFPKPGELDKTTQYLLTGKETLAVDNIPGLASAQIKFDPWQPVLSSSVFVLLMLLAASVYIERQEF